MSKKIISEIANRDTFFHLLGVNPGLIILKLGASYYLIINSTHLI